MFMVFDCNLGYSYDNSSGPNDEFPRHFRIKLILL